MHCVSLCVVVAACIVIAHPRKVQTGPCTVEHCVQCNPKGNKCLTCAEGYTNNKKKTLCFIPTAIIDPDYIEGNAIPAGSCEDFDKDAFVADIMDQVKVLISQSKDKAITAAKALDDALDTGSQVTDTEFLKEPEIQALIDAAVGAEIDAARDDILGDVQTLVDESAGSGGSGGAGVIDDTKCLRTFEGKEYIGTHSVTVTGKKCLPWKDLPVKGTNKNKQWFYNINYFPYDTDMESVSNHCRNIWEPLTGFSRPWCHHTVEPEPAGVTGSYGQGDDFEYYDFCDIPLCGATNPIEVFADKVIKFGNSWGEDDIGTYAGSRG